MRKKKSNSCPDSLSPTNESRLVRSAAGAGVGRTGVTGFLVTFTFTSYRSEARSRSMKQMVKSEAQVEAEIKRCRW